MVISNLKIGTSYFFYPLRGICERKYTLPYSKVSLWEIAIKQAIGKLRYKHSIPQIERLCQDENFIEARVTASEIEKVKDLPFIHSDPFDRLIVSQATANDFTIITRDTIIPKYPVKTLW